MNSLINRFRMIPPAALLLASLAVPALLPAFGQKEASAPAAGPAESKLPAGSSEAAETAEADPLQARLSALGFQLPQSPFEAPAFQLETLDGRKVSLEDHRGKLVFLNFWATWCPPCREEMPSMQALYEKLGGDRFVILAVDLQEDNPAVQQFVKEHGLTFPVLLDRTGRVGQTYGARSIPTTYLVDPKGVVLARTIGGRSWDSPEVVELFRDLIGR